MLFFVDNCSCLLVDEMHYLWQNGLDAVIDNHMLALSNCILSGLGTDSGAHLLLREAITGHDALDAHWSRGSHMPHLVHHPVKTCRSQ